MILFKLVARRVSPGGENGLFQENTPLYAFIVSQLPVVEASCMGGPYGVFKRIHTSEALYSMIAREWKLQKLFFLLKIFSENIKADKRKPVEEKNKVTKSWNRYSSELETRSVEILIWHCLEELVGYKFLEALETT